MRTRLVVGAVVVLVLAAPGSPDIGYSPAGSVAYGPVGGGGADGLRQLVPRADGGVIATGNPDRPLTRITAAGVVDPDWGAALPDDCRRISRAVASGTGVLATCSHLVSPTAGEAWQVWRVTAGGQLDRGFGGGDGIVDVPTTVKELDVAPLAGGGLLGLGYGAALGSATSVTPLVALVYSATGSPVTTSEIPIAVQPLPENITTGWRITARLAPTPTGAVAVEELDTTLQSNDFEIGQTRVQHFDASGAVADSPAFSGPSVGSIVGSEYMWGFAPLPDGRTALVGESYAADLQNELILHDFFLRVVRADGSPDPSFGSVGTVPLRLANNVVMNPRAVVATNGGRYLVVAGRSQVGPALVARYDAATGALDPTFGDGGRAGVTLKTVDALATRAGSDQLYLGGTNASDRPAVARIWGHTVP